MTQTARCVFPDKFQMEKVSKLLFSKRQISWKAEQDQAGLKNKVTGSFLKIYI